MTEVREQITELLEKEMDRKHFLQYSGGVFLAAFGVSGLITALLARQKSLSGAKTNSMKGYGSSKFGKS